MTQERSDPSPSGCPVRKTIKLENVPESKYIRMFPRLRVPEATEERLIELGCSGAVLDDMSTQDKDSKLRDNHCIPAGFTVLAQFVAHDITADKSTPQQHLTTRNIVNYRQAKLDLEPLYAGDPITCPYLYDKDNQAKFLIGANDQGLPNDLPRNGQGIAIIGDQRNDVHLLISQMQLAFMKFHNSIVDHLAKMGMPVETLYPEARRLVRWHYQWIVLHEFLPHTVGQALVNTILKEGLKYYKVEDPHIPVEFADAAFRYGHSQIRAVYHLNHDVKGPIYPDFMGHRPVPQKKVLDWRYYFPIDPLFTPQPTRQIDTKLTHSLIVLPEEIAGKTDNRALASLAVRDLLRGKNLSLPSGEALAQFMNEAPLTKEEVGLDFLEWTGETPLWFYILKEAMVRNNGEFLGPVGGRIVAEVLIGLIKADPHSFYSCDPNWMPTLPREHEETFLMTDLLKFAGVSIKSG